jgi:rhodanese-related sulfurtransferase
MRKAPVIAIVLFSMFCLSCTHEYKRPDNMDAVFKPVGPAEALELIDGRRGIQIVDTRTGWERIGGWIANSVHISYFTFLFGGGYEKIDKNKPVLLICAHGARSYRVGRSLVKKGWMEIYVLEGGMKAWLSDGYPVLDDRNEGPDKAITEHSP